MKKVIALIIGLCAGSFAAIAQAAAVDLTTVTFDMGPVELLLGIVCVGLLAMWGFRKFIKTANRS